MKLFQAEGLNYYIILLDTRKKITTPIEASKITPDKTTISRRIHALAEGINHSFLLDLTVVFF